MEAMVGGTSWTGLQRWPGASSRGGCAPSAFARVGGVAQCRPRVAGVADARGRLGATNGRLRRVRVQGVQNCILDVALEECSGQSMGRG